MPEITGETPPNEHFKGLEGAFERPDLWPADQVERRRVADLVPYARNSRTHSDEQVAKIARSIEEFGWTIPVLIDEEGTLIAGHGRIMAAQRLGIEDVPAMVARGWSPEKRAAYVIADNKLAEEAGWDEALLRLELGEIQAAGFDLELTGFDASFLEGIEEQVRGREAKQSLADRFGLVPFSVLSAREGWWQDRKRAWLALGIVSELGRGENLLQMSDTMLEPDPEKRAKKKAAGRVMGQDLMNGEGKFGPSNGDTEKGKRLRPLINGQTEDLRGGLTHRTTTDPYRSGPAKATGTQAWVQEKIAAGDIEGGMASNQTGTSIFDPVLCELSYRWFCPPGGTVLDPFAGGSVRGLVASRLGRDYVGVDLRGEQIEANRTQAHIGGDGKLTWIEGDSRNIVDLTAGHLPEGGADMIFSCPPYADLEVYSDNPADISTLGYAEFREAYFEIIAQAAKLLKKDGFAVFVVGEVRGPDGNYYGFVPDTIEAFKRAGLEFYNEAILVTAAGSLPMRTAKQFEASRKLGKTHQNVLMFVKGSGKAATAAIGPVEFGEIPADELADQAGGPASEPDEKIDTASDEGEKIIVDLGSDEEFGERL